MPNTSLKEILVDRAILVPHQVAEAAQAAHGTGCTWLERLFFLGILDEEGLASWVSVVARIPTSDARRMTTVDARVRARIPMEVAFEHRAVPFAIDDDGYLHVALVDPLDSVAIEEIEFFAGLPIIRYVAPATHIAWALYQHYGVASLLWPRAEVAAAG